MVAVIRSSRKSSAAAPSSSPKVAAHSRSAASSPTAMARKLSIIGSKPPVAAAASSTSGAKKKKLVSKLRADKPLRRRAAAAASSQSAPASPQQQPSVIPPLQLTIDNVADAQPQQPQPEPQQQEQQQPQQTAGGPEVPPSPTMSDAPASESEPVYTAEEQKMLATLKSVRERLQFIEAGLPMLRGQIGYHLARIALFRLFPRYRSPTLNALKLHLAHSSLRYRAGLVDEQTMQAIFRLDSLQTDNEHIRRERKATVAWGHRIIADSVQIVKRIDNIARLLPPKPKDEQEEEKQTQEQQQEQKPAATEDMSDVSDAEEEEEEKEEKEQPPVIPQQKQQKQPAADVEMRPASPTAAAAPVSPSRAAFAPGRQLPPRPTSRATPPPPAAAAPAPALAATPAAPTPNPLLRKYAALNLPEWRGPAFHSSVHPLTGSLLIEADLSGVRAEDLQVMADPTTRVLTIRGVKLPQRRRSVPAYADFFGFGDPFGGLRSASVEPHGHFEKRIDFKELDPTGALHLAGMSAVLNADERLEITIPRAPKQASAVPQTARKAPVQQQRQQPQTARVVPQPQRRPAVQHSSGYGFSDEDDEEEQYAPRYAAPQRAAYAPHPFYTARPQTAPRRQMYAPSPFFGGFW